MNRPRMVIAGTQSGAGKTTVTLALMAALTRRGMKVQGFKVGPDYIDPSYHSAVTKVPSRNLDTWLMSCEVVREVFHRGSENADISVVEGVMGLYDGKDPLSNAGSTAQVSLLLDAPVLLVVDVASVARSAAAMVLGFQQMEPRLRLAGVIVNQVGSKGHFELVKSAIEQVCKVPVVGYLTHRATMRIPERHLGLIPALERQEMAPLIDSLADAADDSIDVDAILSLANLHAAWEPPTPSLFVGEPRAKTVTLAVARDSAFNFYYPENLELLEWYGAKLVYFRPLEGEIVPPSADGLYIGGGFPEEFAKRLAGQRGVLESVRCAVHNGMPVYAECGGFMFLTNTLTDAHGRAHEMVGIVPAMVRMQSELAALGYREVTARTDNLLLLRGEVARGHEFHYSTATHDDTDWPYAYDTHGWGVRQEGYANGNVLAGYTHLHFASNPQMVERLIQACRDYRNHSEDSCITITKSGLSRAD
ncbi:cobyrinate a,c-diamide synthase [Alicyclobacillus fastidiosus]|uniref:Cobyrinate a,c-diamide synthase n=1 Tax=Alicyclobacillus fastidiosus TaxID=392011 RepID=A0ABY6ZEY3_9BACL|nr:cobyrinate a,c-diamide synthase [Alicyclobacillus fastidiosus]WAH41118.1 cobyrinate a,c-diamide synthase [Alicyclobacillus fastidiosus]GMA62674.1 cobyrinate a,c-diamide synthase [Alicyclobacillus fastidiosus]